MNADILVGKSSTCLDDALRQEIIQSDIKPPVFTKLLKHLHLVEFDIPLENIHEVNVEAMIKSHYFTFSADMYTELSESYPALSEAYILENKDAFLAEASTIPLEKDVFESLITSKQTDNAFKESIIKTHGVKLMSILQMSFQRIFYFLVLTCGGIYDTMDTQSLGRRRARCRHCQNWIN